MSRSAICRSTLVASLSALMAAAPALACSPPPPVCETANGQVAVLEGVDGPDGTTVMFSQYDPGAAHQALTYVVVDCRTRQAVALGDLQGADTDSGAMDTHFAGRMVMSDEVFSGARPRLGRLHRQLQRMGLRSKHFTLLKSHCGCALPDLPPPPSSCPPY
ncbi:MAG: hypothetical protein ACE369_05745 [Roseovarius sp.]